MLFLPCILLLRLVDAQKTQVSLPEVQRMSKALQFETVSSYDSAAYNPIPFKKFISYLQKSFPLTHERLQWKLVNDYSLIYNWKGVDSSLKPALFLAHYDVVPAEDMTLNKWKYSPFSGHTDSLFIWGRGALDDKFQVMSLLEATEKLLQENFIPVQSIYLAFGHDEETGGEEGARVMAAYFQQQKLEFSFILDEGGMMAKDLFPGVNKTIAFISIAEKGDANVELTVKEKGGHSAVPPLETSIEILSRAIVNINEHPMPARLQTPIDEMLKALAPYLDTKSRLAVRNKWLFRKKILKDLSANYGTNSLIRTVMSSTMITGGAKENALPTHASANINIRLLQGDDIGAVLDHLKNVIRDERVAIRLKEPYHHASAITPLESKEYSLLSKTILQYYPDVVVAPLVAPGTTDSRHYAALSKNILRFMPVTIDLETKEQIHGINERISITDYLQSIRFYRGMIKNLNEEQKLYVK